MLHEIICSEEAHTVQTKKKRSNETSTNATIGIQLISMMFLELPISNFQQAVYSRVKNAQTPLKGDLCFRFLPTVIWERHINIKS